jgi:hypothetical protein
LDHDTCLALMARSDVFVPTHAAGRRFDFGAGSAVARRAGGGEPGRRST